MHLRRRDRPLVLLLGAASIAFGCSRLTEIDWALVQAPSDGSAGSIGTAGAPDAGQPGSGGNGADEGGAPNGGVSEGGAADGPEPYGGTTTSGGTAGNGNGGSSAGGVGGSAGSSGSGGSAGSGGNGGSGGGPDNTIPPCTPTTGPVAGALVLFASPAKPTAARGGRAGLDADCEAQRKTLALPQTKSHAFITIATDDYIGNWINPQTPQFSDIPIGQHVVGPTGIEIASSLTSLVEGSVERSLTCAQVLPQDALYWISGSGNTGVPVTANSTVFIYGQFTQPIDNCTGWTSGVHDPITRGRPGSAIYADQRLLCAAQTSIQVTYLFLGCDTTSMAPALCLAYTP